MALTPGTKVGPYEITALIGAGGMGEVYRARDARLGRDVAIKVLPSSFAADPERLRRFEQEARAVAALSHPNILAVHDIGQHEGAPFLVSELLEGETLREILNRSMPSHRKAIEYSVQIAHGLAAAHSKDIAHRDLKPDNIFVTRDGRVKILDFGLAKTVAKPILRGQDAGTMTAVGPATDVGTVMGTVSYMSPEQVRGEAVDCRTDVFSFGAVLYEMLTGERAFKRDTAPETMTAILKDEPPESLASGRQIPPALDRILRHCLEKVPEQRFQSARDLAFDLESISSLTASGGMSTAAVKQTRRWLSLAALAALLLFAIAVGWKLSSWLRPAEGSRFHQVTYRRGTLGDSRFSPDGKNILYTALWEGALPEIYTVPMDGVGGHPVGIQNARLLAVSSKGELAVSLSPKIVTALLIVGDLARTSNNSGAPKAEIENVLAADFTPDGSALAIVRGSMERLICQLEYPIGKVLYEAPAINNLRFSRDGRYLAFIVHSDPTDDRGNVVILRSTGEKVATSQLFESAAGLAWSADGNEVWVTSPLESGEIHAISLAGKSRVPLAVPGRLRLQDINGDGLILAEQGISRRGMVVSDGKSTRDVSWLDFGYLRSISDDGKTILFEEEGTETANYRVFMRDVDGSPAVGLGEGYALALSNDKKWALSLRLTEPRELWLLPTGVGEARRLNPPSLSNPEIAGSFLPDNKRVIYIAHESGKRDRVWIQDIDSDKPRPLTEEGLGGSGVSVDGKWLIGGYGNPAAGIQRTVLVSIENGGVKEIKGLKPTDNVLGWAIDGQLYVSPPGTDRLRIEKLNPDSGARSPWRDLEIPVIGGVRPELPIITPDGKTYAFDYRLRMSDLYTLKGVH